MVTLQLSNFMISLFVPFQSFVRVKDHVTWRTLIREGVGEVNTFNVKPGISLGSRRELITNCTHESCSGLADVLFKVLRFCYCHPLNTEYYEAFYLCCRTWWTLNDPLVLNVLPQGGGHWYVKVFGKCWLSIWFLVSLVLLQVNEKQMEQTNLPPAFVMNWLKSSGFSIEPLIKRE